ncbi:MAG TPA: PLP-dependent transferase [Thermomicrobiales bacterium]|nr:PLP-dependent transferase [Thermomicrobiales bacterium]HRA47443.1 PLP-dependent transferase [Thermomicrobiales bacterium]
MAENLAIDTLAVKGGWEPTLGQGLSPDINLSSTHVLPADGDQGPIGYGRGDSPSFQVFERALADVNGAAHALAFNSGTSAMVALAEEARPGDRIVFSAEAYHGFLVYAEDVLRSRGVAVEFIDLRNLEAVEAAVPGARFLWAETPTNPHIRCCDLVAIAEICAVSGVPWFADNTFATAVHTRPLEMGALAVMESVTKYVAGHSDLIMGGVSTNDDALRERLSHRRAQIGTQPDGFTCFLARRGLQTMPVRVRHQSATALELANRLDTHPNVEHVYYPGLPGDEDHELAKRQMTGGFGGMLSFVLAGGREAANRLTEQVRVWIPATSLGSVESLVERRARWDGDTVVPGLLRLSVGLEGVEDLWADLEQAMA